MRRMRAKARIEKRKREQAEFSEFEKLQDPYQEEFELQLRIFDAVTSEEDLDSAVIRNQMAYARACAGMELDVALEDINYALERYPENYGFLDTRAWVQFRRGEFQLALKDADTAIEELHEAIERANADPLTKALSGVWSALDSEVPAAPSDETEQNDTLEQESVLPEIWLEGVLRYHRLKILEAISKEEEAALDRAWLTKHRLPQDGSLH